MVFGRSFFGYHPDDLFAYETQKVVRIRDRRLGLLYYGLLFVILFYVIGFQILYRNEHFMRRDVYGTSRMTIQQPTMRCNPNKPNCKSDFNSLEVLPYCSVYTGNSNEVAPEFRQRCTFADQHTLAPTGMLLGDMLVPTRIDEMVESKGCEPSPANHWTCENEFTVDNEPEIIYTADIERYTILVAHSFKRDTISGNNGEMQGKYLDCVTEEASSEGLSGITKGLKTTLEGDHECKGKWVTKEIHCITGTCHFDDSDSSSFLATSKKKASLIQEGASHKQRSSATHDAGYDPTHRHMLNGKHSRRSAGPGAGTGHSGASVPSVHLMDTTVENALEGHPSAKELAQGGVFSIPDGDIFAIWKLLELAGLSLDHTFNKAGEPLREAGTVIELEVIYNNMHPWLSSFGYAPVGYEYKVTQRPMEEMKTEMFSQHQDRWPQARVIENRHGLFLTVKISGAFGFFSIVYLLIMLTTAVGLLGVAVVIVDKLSIYVMSEKETYNGHKYENTKLFESDDLPFALPGAHT